MEPAVPTLGRRRSTPELPDGDPRPHLPQERLRRHPGDRSEIRDQMRLIVVPRLQRDRRPARRLTRARRIERTAETFEPREGLRPHAYCVAEDAAEVSL